MRTPLIAANFKMNLLRADLETYAQEFITLVMDIKGREVIICPPFPYLDFLHQRFLGTGIEFGGQNLAEKENGAFTGEVSAEMLVDCKVKWVLIGHSERRALFHETDEVVNTKIRRALQAGLKPIICVGETLDLREANQAESHVEKQLGAGLKEIDPELIKACNFAYEPVWAIGTGKTASAQDAQSMQNFMRKWLAKQISPDFAASTRILYGGSVKPENAAELMAQPDVDGLLVGGASLKADSFGAIVNY